MRATVLFIFSALIWSVALAQTSSEPAMVAQAAQNAQPVKVDSKDQKAVPAKQTATLKTETTDKTSAEKKDVIVAQNTNTATDAKAAVKAEPAKAAVKVEPAKAAVKVEPAKADVKAEPAKAAVKVEPAIKDTAEEKDAAVSHENKTAKTDAADTKGGKKSEPAKVPAEKTEPSAKKASISPAQPVKTEDIKGQKNAPTPKVVPAKQPAPKAAPASKQKTSKAVSEQPAVARKAAAVPAQENKSVLEVARSAIATNVAKLEPENQGTEFAPQSRLYCFTQIKGASDTIEIYHKWYWKNRLIGYCPLKIKSSSFRTYSIRTIPEKMSGEWRVDVVDKENDKVLKSLSFLIK